MYSGSKSIESVQLKANRICRSSDSVIGSSRSRQQQDLRNVRKEPKEENGHKNVFGLCGYI